MFAFDFEAFLISPWANPPRAVCMSYARSDARPEKSSAVEEKTSRFSLTSEETHRKVSESDVLIASDGIALLWKTLTQTDELLVGANTAFDVLVSVCSSPRPEEMCHAWITAYEQDRVTDVLLRQPLIDLSYGRWGKYSLAAVCAVLGTPTRPDKSSPWRLRYSELYGVPISKYPADAVKYSLEDSVATAEAWITQEELREFRNPYFPGRDVLLNQYHQARGALALYDLSSIGLRADKKTVSRFRDMVTARFQELEKKLIAEGLVRPECKLDTEAVWRRAGLTKRTPTGRPSLPKKLLAQSQDAALRAAADWHSHEKFLLEEGLVKVVKYHRDTAAAERRITAAFEKLGKPVMRKEPKRKRGVPLPPESEWSIRLDNDACTKSCDTVMAGYAEYSGLSKTISTDIEALVKASVAPLQAHYRVMQHTGRTSTGAEEDDDDKVNAQNFPRKPGVRECYWPRKGNVFVSADYTAAELSTFSQVCMWVVGWSKLGDMIKAGIDSHLKIGIMLLPGMTYEEALPRVKDTDIARVRTAGKGINFGRKGAMGAKKFVKYAWNNYRVEVDLPTAEKLIAAHDAQVPEFLYYSQWATGFAREPGAWDTVYDLVMPWSGRCVAGLEYSSVHNYPFQGLAADVAKLALWKTFKARWGYNGHDDPLYQCFPVQFTHDDIVYEAPEARGEAAAYRLRDLMQEASREILTDIPLLAEPQIHRQLSKKAKPVTRDGHLVPWDAWEQCREEAKKLADSGERDIATVLRKHEWPEYVIEDVLC